MPPVEAWAKVFITGEGGEEFLNDTEVHMRLGCIGCHGGNEGRNTKDVAHEGFDVDPSEGENNKCADLCHQPELGHYYTDSVHATQVGYKTLFTERSGTTIDGHPEFEEGFEADCSACHASCGDCHISQPNNVGGGLVNGHMINRTPDQIRNCTACHGSRVGDEYTGANDYAGFDAHYIPGRMQCVDCHTAQEMHGTPGAAPQTRYEEPNMPRCEDCHSDDLDANSYHTSHLAGNTTSLQCQVCHSQTYKSCNACHVGEGITGSSYPSFEIGRNPIPDLRSEYEYVLLRHIPIAEDTFRGWGLEDLENYEDVETWKYTSPHNIRRLGTAVDPDGDGTPSCDGCHSDSPEQDLFLRASDLEDLSADEQAANQDVIVPSGTPFSLGRTDR